MLDEPFYPLYFLAENARPREKERERERNDMLVQTILRTSLPLYLLYLARIREHTCARHSYSQSRFSFSRGSLIFFLVTRSLPTRLNASSGRGSQGVTVFAAALVALLLVSLT
jgi:hypothetical protein